jgi:hypothetical protein
MRGEGCSRRESKVERGGRNKGKERRNGRGIEDGEM